MRVAGRAFSELGGCLDEKETAAQRDNDEEQNEDQDEEKYRGVCTAGWQRRFVAIKVSMKGRSLMEEWHEGIAAGRLMDRHRGLPVRTAERVVVP